MPVAAVLAVGAVVSAVSAKKAAKAQTNAAQAGINEQQRQYEQTRTDQAPYQQAGTQALANLQNPQEAFKASPSYNFVRSEGNRGIENSFAGRGSGQSGNALKALAEFNQNLASSEFGSWWNQQAGLVGAGQNANNSLGVMGQRTSDNIATLKVDQGNARASGIQGVNDSLINLGGNYLGAKQGGYFGKKPQTAPYGQMFGNNNWAAGDGVRRPKPKANYWS